MVFSLGLRNVSEDAGRFLCVTALLAACLLGAWAAWACHRAQRRGLPGDAVPSIARKNPHVLRHYSESRIMPSDSSMSAIDWQFPSEFARHNLSSPKFGPPTARVLSNDRCMCDQLSTA